MTTQELLTISTPDERSRRWDEEARFFDERAADLDDASLRIDPLALQRYSRELLRKRFNKEFRLHLLRPLEGKTLLDIGCGDGLNTVMFAKMGARVTGVDISPGAIDAARRRAELNGVSERVTLVCAPAETADLPADAFDVVWGDAILHHVLEDLELVLRNLARVCKPSGLMLFAEPVNQANFLRRARALIPVHTDATPDERPLIKREIDLLDQHMLNLRVRAYSLFGRLDRFILVNYNYEHSSWARRALLNAVCAVDYALLSLPLLKRLGGVGVVCGPPRKQ
jgi:2-polyprenyl-3-methyl-5-hydroxy-6-metoxy-1,4-benzoquinol methylase